MTSLVLRALELVWAVDVPDEATALLHLLGDLATEPGPTDGAWQIRPAPVGWVLTDESERLLASAAEWQPLAQQLLLLLNATALHRPGFTAHAAVVAGAAGAAVLPGASGLGKTTLSAACLGAGLTYLSDEGAALMPDDRVLPYPRPLALDDTSVALLGLPRPALAVDGDRWFRASDLGAVAGADPVAVTHLVVPCRRPGRAELRPTGRLSAADTLLRMGFNHYLDPGGSFELVTGLASRAAVWELGYAEAPAAAELLRELLA